MESLMEDSLSQLSLQSHAAASPRATDDASKQRKRRKQKKSKSKVSSSLSVLGSSTTPLPSQKCLEARFPWMIIIRPQRGRCAIATRDIKAGELIISEQALAFVLRSRYRTAACHACCRDFSDTSPGIQCQDCNYALFCEDCRQVTPESHRECCPVLRKIGDIAEQTDCDGDLLRLAMLLGLQRSSSILKSNQVPCDCSPGEIKGDVLHPSFQDAMGLQTHQDKVSASWKSSVKKGCEMLVDQASNHITNFLSSAGSGENGLKRRKEDMYRNVHIT